MPSLRYILEWHYQHLDFNSSMQSYLVKQHASAAINLLDCGNIVTMMPMFVDIIEICLCKWFNAAAGMQNGLQDAAQKILLSTCLNIATKFVKNSVNQFKSFIENYFRLFLESESFLALCKGMR